MRHLGVLHEFLPEPGELTERDSESCGGLLEGHVAGSDFDREVKLHDNEGQPSPLV